MPPANVKPVAQVAEKWARRVGGASQDYVTGAQGAGTRWQTNAKAGKANYAAGVQEAIGKNRYEKGIDASGAGAYQAGVMDKGAVRYGPGASASQGKFAGAIGPVLDVISRTDLPPRGPRGAEGNYTRSAAIGKALRTFAQSR